MKHITASIKIDKKTPTTVRPNDSTLKQKPKPQRDTVDNRIIKNI